MNIHPRPDQESAIQDALKAGLIKNEVDALDTWFGKLAFKAYKIWRLKR